MKGIVVGRDGTNDEIMHACLARQENTGRRGMSRESLRKEIFLALREEE
jgi:hypothetical protein